MSVVFTILEIVLAIFIYVLLSPYINYLTNIMALVIPTYIMNFILLGIFVSVLLFIIHRGGKND